MLNSRQILDHALRLIAVELDLAQRAARLFREGRSNYIGTHSVLELCRERISTYADAFAGLLESFSQHDLAVDLREQHTFSTATLNQLINSLLQSLREGFDAFGQPHSGPVLGEEFRAQAALHAQAFWLDPATCALPIAAQLHSARCASPDLSSPRSDPPHPAPRSGTA